MDSFQTRISSYNYDRIKTHTMTPSEMISFLEDGALYRTFRDVLLSVYPEEDLVPRLSHGLSEISGTEYESTQRKVRNWMRGSNTPQNREQLFQIAFVLGLSEDDASSLLASASECGIHYRNPVELVYAFALRNGMSWADAQALLAEMRPLYVDSLQTAKHNSRIIDTAPAARGFYDNRAAASWDNSPVHSLSSVQSNTRAKSAGSFAGKTGESSPAHNVIYTRQLRDEFADVHTTEDLRSFFYMYAAQLGEIHESAYEKFMELLGYLQAPTGGKVYQSIEQVVDEYLCMNVPTTKNSSKMSYLQKVVKKNWPTETEITKMKTRTIDVSRKALLLLFLITEDFEFNHAYEEEEDNANWDIYYEDLIEDDPEERLEIRLNQINLFLERYGMNLLDPGNPFDCLVLYALRAEYDEDDSMSEKVKDALAILFRNM